MGVELPWTSDEFVQAWVTWKQYKKEEHKFRYKSDISEKAALKKLRSISGDNESVAILIIEHAIGNGWKGFFAINNKSNTSSAPGSSWEDAAKNLKNDLLNGRNNSI